ncbi:hypothetical protein BTVI_112869 [Pitangus sulphuratus]|nr:hypothetical protein BTVI_112869 [Pitangus sulphuratus]
MEKSHESMKEKDKTWKNEDECTEAVKWLKWEIDRLKKTERMGGKDTGKKFLKKFSPTQVVSKILLKFDLPKQTLPCVSHKEASWWTAAAELTANEGPGGPSQKMKECKRQGMGKSLLKLFFNGL